MPTALIVTLRPSAAATVPADLARAAHAAVLRLVSAASPALAAQIHDEAGVKPLTVSNVLGLDAQRERASVTPTRDYGLRITLLSPELERLAADWNAGEIGSLELDGLAWQVERITTDQNEHPWAGQEGYEALLVPSVLRAADGASRWTLEFASPVTFRQRGLNQPLPTADLVFGSLFDKWNALAPTAFPEEIRRFAAECIAVSRFDLRSIAAPTKGGALQIGAVGRCSYAAVNRDRYWMACIETLAHFAFYSGVGAGTARGFGRTRLVQ